MNSAYIYRRLSKDDATVLFVDHQSGLTVLVQDYPPNEFKNAILALADMAKYFNLPTILSFNPASREAAWLRMAKAGVQLLDWFAVGSELHCGWRNDIQGFGKLLCDHTPIYQSLMTSYAAQGRA